MFLILRWILSALTLLVVAELIPGFEVASFTYALIAAVFIGLANALIRPILLILTLPVNILTLGLFTFVINALILLIVANILDGFEITGFSAAFWGALTLWAMNLIINLFLGGKK